MLRKVSKKNPIYGWHFLPSNGRLAQIGYNPENHKLPVKAGYIYSRSGKIKLCYNGLHASSRLYDALFHNHNLDGPICRVALWGDVDETFDKVAAQHRGVIWMASPKDLGYLSWPRQRITLTCFLERFAKKHNYTDDMWVW